MVCGFSAGVTLGTTAGLTTGGMIGRMPGIPGTGGRDTAGSAPIAPGGRRGNAGRTNDGYGAG